MAKRNEDVDAWFDGQSHELTDAARSIRDAILRAVPEAQESIKWRAPNFAVADDFATFSMRRPGVLQVILHTGAKPKPDAPAIQVGDLGGRLKWAAHNRAIVTFTSADEVSTSMADFETVIREWVTQLTHGAD